MNTHDLDNFRLAAAVTFNDELNPKLFSGHRLKPEIRKHLLEIAADFKQFLGVTDLELKDITISGSNAAYTYTATSDIDLHLVVDLPQADRSTVFRELFDAKKYQYNDLYDIKVKGYDVELYVQNANEKHISSGIYSLVNDDWVSIPKKRDFADADISVAAKFKDLLARSKEALKSNNSEQIAALLKKISLLRRAGLEAGGELSPENLAFKLLRKAGVIDRLHARKNAAKSNELSLESSKTPAEYGWVGDAVAEEVLPDVKTPGVNAIAKKHRVSPEAIRKQLSRGIKVELEHTTDPKLAREIALDHLAEMPDYYSRLARMEKGAVKEAADALAPRELAAQFRAQIAARYPGVVVDLFAATHGGLHLSKIEIPKDKRKLGMATEILKGIAALADKNWLVVSLSPTNEFGTPKTVLVEFYKRFGFVFNRGRNKDYRISETMYREPRPLAECAGRITPQNQTADVGPDEIKRQAAKFGNMVDRDGYPARKMTDRAVTESLEPGVKELAQQWAAFQKTSAAESATPEIYPIRDFPIYSADGIVDGMASVERHLLLSEGAEPDLDTDLVDFLKDLVSLSKPVVGKEHITVLISVIGNQLHLNNSVEITTFERSTVEDGVNVVVLRPKNGPAFKFPRFHLRSKSFWAPFLFRTVESYNKFRTALSLKTSISLPDVNTLNASANPQKKLIAETVEDLFEVNMSPGVLKQWAQSSAAAGIRLGFEAELIFPGYGAGDAQTYEDDDAWNETTIESIDQIASMFPNDYDDQYRLDRALRTLDHEYNSYVKDLQSSRAEEEASEAWAEHRFQNDWEEFRDEWIRNAASEDDYSDEEIDELLDNPQSREYYSYSQKAQEEFDSIIQDEIAAGNGEFRRFVRQYQSGIDVDSFEDWASNEGYGTMYDFMRHFRLDYPPIPGSSGQEYSVAEAERLAGDLSYLTGEDYTVLTGYHAKEKDISKWYIESDGSISVPESLTHAMPVEIVSPAMPLDQALDAMSLFFNSVRRMGAISNQSTGFHMSLSINEGPLANEQPNYLKLVLFTGDEYVLDQFSRASNAYAKSAAAQLAQSDPLDTDRAAKILDYFRKGIVSVAANAFVQANSTRYSAVNMKGNYVEFRAAGGADYSNDVNKLIQTAYRYAYAYAIAVDNSAYRNEFAKKLYKFISDFRLPMPSDTIQLFANYAVDKNVASLKRGLAMYRGRRHQPDVQKLVRLLFDTAINTLTTYTNNWRSRGTWRPVDDEVLRPILAQWQAAAATETAGAAQTIIRDLNSLVNSQALEQQTMRILRDEIFDEFSAAAREQGLIQQ